MATNASAQEPGPSPTERPAEPTPSRIPGPDYLRAFLMDSAMLVGGSIWYWIDDRNIVDWDFESWNQRFSEEAYRFDNNEFPINFIGHPLSGAAYYGVPRTNRMDVYTSFLYGLLTSFIWEFFLEFQERFSLNDFVATPLGGLPIGEGFFRLGRWLDNVAHPAFAWTLGIPVALMELLDGRHVGADGPGTVDEDPGYAEIVTELGGSVGTLDGREPIDVSRLGMNASFFALDGYREPGESVDGFFDAEVTNLRMDAFLSTAGAGFELEADTILFGMHARAITGSTTHPRGTTAIIGSSVSHFYRFENYEPWHERISYTGFPGLAVDVEERLGDLAVRFDGRGQAIFGASNASRELDRWRRAHPGAVPKSILERHELWYGWGWTARARISFDLGPLRLWGALRYIVLDSQEGYDRNEELVTEDADGWGQLIEPTVGARLLLGDLVTLRARWQRQDRAGRLGEITSRRTLDRYELSVGLRFAN